MSWTPQTQKWAGDQAVLFIHGIGEAKPGDYDFLLKEFDAAVGPKMAGGVAKYFLYYNDVNDWMQDKVKLKDSLATLCKYIRDQVAKDLDPVLGEAVAKYFGDVLLPILNEAARVAVRDRALAQLLQLRLDGVASGIPLARQKVSLIAHSMGCFHTYEALHAAASIPSFKLTPLADLMQFRSVMFMASPVKLIRSVASVFGSIVPSRGLASLSPSGLFRPFEVEPVMKNKVPVTRNWISITGDLDPVGGHFFKVRAPWAYMMMDGQDSKIDDQSALNIKSKAELAGVLADLAVNKSLSPNTLRNPHAWEVYIRNHAQEIVQWLS